MSASLSSRSRALRNPSQHRFIRGRGYVDLGADPVLKHVHAPIGRCSPPPGAVDGSWHALTSPGGPSVNFQWLAASKSWFRQDSRSRRLGYTPDYLSQAGWTYGGPAQGPHN